ncbi:ribosomal RNA-processing protein 8-like isoform X1 [Corythoichthys intestinalis]|uniref:ribosomal RNA-processing protein 8-like isoform X1 n=1 Tax=Corythoichthys intestinalis TaxID=161448 RepID=UPI0025A5FFDD|nr:ribosomal RNA-processing protein 8-like isoform X1 [Corythoichthys intestinalis]
MFNEDDDWNDAAEVLSQSVEKKKPNSAKVKSKNVGKKSLLRTLQTLGSIPDWKNEDQRQIDSDSDTAVAMQHTKKKKKKSRKKRTKKGTTTAGVQSNNVDVKKEQKVTKKKKVEKKIGVPNDKHAPAEAVVGKETPPKPAGDAPKLSRQQWKNKMKSKRKCKNKFRQDKLENKVEKAGELLPSTCSIPNGGGPVEVRHEKKMPQKRKKTVDDQSPLPLKTAKKEGEQTLNGLKHGGDNSRANRLKGELCKAEKLKRDRLRKLLQQVSPEEPEEEVQSVPEENEEVKEDRSTLLRLRMEQRLESARFRYINELLYSSTSGEAKRMFKQDPQAFQIYHKGYTAQVSRWPTNPVDAIISYIKNKPASLVVADFGCGDCKIARSVKNKVHSFDLVATCDLVTVCDMAKVPLEDRSVSIAVFCLSLMGTNLAEFLAEANRVLKRGGVLKIAEVASRFENVRNFINALARLGFKMVSKDTDNTHFFSFEFMKTGDAPANVKKFGLQLKACLYKKR